MAADFKKFEKSVARLVKNADWPTDKEGNRFKIELDSDRKDKALCFTSMSPSPDAKIAFIVRSEYVQNLFNKSLRILRAFVKEKWIPTPVKS